MARLHVHPLHLGGCRVKEADGAGTDRHAVLSSYQKGAPAGLEVLRLEVRPEALLGRIELGKLRVERLDQAPRVVGLE